MGLRASTLIAPEPREARHYAEFPGAGLLSTGDCERAFEVGLRFPLIALRRQHFDFATDAMDLGVEPLGSGILRRRHRFANATPRVVKLSEISVGLSQVR